MNGYVLIPIIFGSILLVGGVAVAGVAIANGVANSKKETNTFEFTDEQTFDKININLETAELEIKFSTDGKAKVVCDETEKYHHTVAVENGVLKIDSWQNRKWYELFMFDWTKKKVTVYLPSTNYSTLEVQQSTGDIYIPSDFTFENTSINASTGDIKFESKVTNNLSIIASTGRIYANTVSAKEMTLKTSTGGIETNKCSADNLVIRTSTGDVSIIDTIVSNEIDVSASTGDIRFRDSDAGTIKAKTTTGRISGTLLTTKDFYASSTTGHVNVPHSTTGGKCELRTTTGDIDIAIKVA